LGRAALKRREVEGGLPGTAPGQYFRSAGGGGAY
jgi:hypothetical protein